ncbi:cytochrome c [Ochrobactrum sp. AP1BH01-1]|uniref:c-type cytochrome n=1 Tax=Ochrobactrum sp. AP1BH01-1 TaxID=2823874 RepID=UPI001B36A9BC|nr:cytochrome c [Ochrobactrum sp. AP1BH01-1]MBQ0711308.1 cytochrome c [Ochrobactrum sp. AP1BH01-1]
MTTQGKTARLAVAGLGAIWLLAMPAIAQEAAEAAPPDLAETLDQRRSFASGEDTWNKVCARCHTVDGEADARSVGPDLSPNEYDADTLRFFIRNGHLAMPAFPGSALDDATIDDLAAYIATNVHKGE